MCPVTNFKSFQALALEAVDGDADAALMLAKGSPENGFGAWYVRWVPVEDRTDYAVFDRMNDAYDRMLMGREANSKEV